MRFNAVLIANREYDGDFPLYLHCMNVATMATKVAHVMHLDERLCFDAGLLHDVGKMYCGLNIIPDHPALTYSRLKELEVDDLVTCVAAVHHQFQHNPYPEFKECVYKYTEYKEAELISLCDKVEAGMTRGEETPDEALDNALRIFPKYDQDMINALRNVLYSRNTIRKTKYG